MVTQSSVSIPETTTGRISDTNSDKHKTFIYLS
jgi:hypothetical protein